MKLNHFTEIIWLSVGLAPWDLGDKKTKNKPTKKGKKKKSQLSSGGGKRHF